MILNSPYITGSLTVTGNATIAGNITVTGSLSGTATSASYAYTASSAINATSASYAYTASSAINATSASKAVSSSYADTASFANNFTVLGNLTVYGTQSIQYITSSQLNISDNVITVNVASPGVRFGGLSVFDSGSLSSEATASLFWDSQNNHWIYQRESGSTYTGGMLISGPRNAAGLGNEQGTTSCMLLVGQGGDHLTSSMIYHDSTRTCFYTNATLACSNNFGSNLNSIQTFTGSVVMTGSLVVNTTGPELQVNNNGVILGNLLTDNHSITGSLRVTGSIASFSNCVGIGMTPTRALDVTGTFRVITPNRSFFITSNAYSISDGTLSSGIGMDGDGLYLGNVASSTGWTIANPQVTIRCSGNVGIGTCNPSYGIDLLSNNSARFKGSNNYMTLLLDNSNASVGGGGTYFLKNGTVGGGIGSSGWWNGDDSNDLLLVATSCKNIRFHTNDSSVERMRITSCGNIGIGTSFVISPYFAGAQTSGVLQVATNVAKTATCNSYPVGFFSSNDATNPLGLYIGIITGATTSARKLKLQGTEIGVSPNSIVMQEDGGNVSIGSALDSGYKLYVKGTNGLYVEGGNSSSNSSFIVNDVTGNTTYFRVRGDGYLQSLTTYNNTTASGANVSISSSGYFERSTSSIKYKKDVRNYNKGLAEIMQMRPVYYKGKGENDGNKEFAGLIAEEVHQICLNEFVTYAEDGSPDALVYQNMIALLIKGMQEQQCTINTLKTCIGIA